MSACTARGWVDQDKIVRLAAACGLDVGKVNSCHIEALITKMLGDSPGFLKYVTPRRQDKTGIR